MFDPRGERMREGVPQAITRTLQKRAYLVERARNANIVGEQLQDCQYNLAMSPVSSSVSILSQWHLKGMR